MKFITLALILFSTSGFASEFYGTYLSNDKSQEFQKRCVYVDYGPTPDDYYLSGMWIKASEKCKGEH